MHPWFARAAAAVQRKGFTPEQALEACHVFIRCAVLMLTVPVGERMKLSVPPTIDQYVWHPLLKHTRLYASVRAVARATYRTHAYFHRRTWRKVLHHFPGGRDDPYPEWRARADRLEALYRDAFGEEIPRTYPGAHATRKAVYADWPVVGNGEYTLIAHSITGQFGVVRHCYGDTIGLLQRWLYRLGGGTGASPPPMSIVHRGKLLPNTAETRLVDVIPGMTTGCVTRVAWHYNLRGC